jgi:hypothetical protein
LPSDNWSQWCRYDGRCWQAGDRYDDVGSGCKVSIVAVKMYSQIKRPDSPVFNGPCRECATGELDIRSPVVVNGTSIHGNLVACCRNPTVTENMILARIRRPIEDIIESANVTNSKVPGKVTWIVSVYNFPVTMVSDCSAVKLASWCTATVWTKASAVCCPTCFTFSII